MPKSCGRAELRALGWEVHVLDGLDHPGHGRIAAVVQGLDEVVK